MKINKPSLLTIKRGILPAVLILRGVNNEYFGIISKHPEYIWVRIMDNRIPQYSNIQEYCDKYNIRYLEDNRALKIPIQLVKIEI